MTSARETTTRREKAAPATKPDLNATLGLPLGGSSRRPSW